MVLDKKYKWDFAIGTTSRVPNSHLHYLILDVDGEWDHNKLGNIFIRFTKSAFIQQTEHGWHIYTNSKLRFNQMEIVLQHLGADKSWIEIGKRRGYWFLADKDAVILPWPVERMVLHAKKS